MAGGRFEFNFNDGIFNLDDHEIVRVVYTHPNQESRLYEYCNLNGLVCYLPLKKVWRPMAQRHGGKVYRYPKVVLRPMFPSYMFVKLTVGQRALLYNSNAIVRILHDADQNQGRLLDDIRVVRQIEAIAQSEAVEFNAEIKEGSKFLIESGPWQGIYGWLKKKQSRFVWTVEIECVSTIVQATIDPSKYRMTPVEEPCAPR